MTIGISQPLYPTAVVVDDFFADPDEVRELALAQKFYAHPEYHKGQRTHTRFLFPELRKTFESLLHLKITKWEEHEANGVFQLCVAGDQIVYHSDEQSWAGVVYLTPGAPPGGGTSMYRSKGNLMRSVAEASAAGLDENLAASEMYDGKLLDGNAWELIDTFGNVYNRLVLWNARLVHAAASYFGYDLQTGRLFQMFFFDAEP